MTECALIIPVMWTCRDEEKQVIAHFVSLPALFLFVLHNFIVSQSGGTSPRFLVVNVALWFLIWAAGNGGRVRANRGRWSRNEWKSRIDYDWLDFFYETGNAYCENPLDKVVKMATVRCDDAMVILFRTTYFIAKESLAFSKFPKLMKLIGSVTDDIPRRLYRDDKACVDFIFYMSQVIQVQVLDWVRASPFWGLMIDESTDVFVTSHLVVFCTFLEDGQIRTAFLDLLHIPHKDSYSIVQEISKRIF
ncbi:hypothetical protein R1sor_018797 [Riccia sorocarpa]|uniref:DUF4371 domain-containing protein n=1 Tax=Riccia sorocarpa TaxID=122646 RepID=A0ABD3IEG3_9MARC